MTIEEMIEFLEDDENASYLACDYNAPKSILLQIAAVLRAGQQIREALNHAGHEGYFTHAIRLRAAAAWDEATK